MLRTLLVRPERLPLREPFRISRGVKTATDVVVVEVREGELVGRGECVPYPRYGESSESVVQQLSALGQRLSAGEDPHAVAAVLPPGAARNALDCAAWDLAAQRKGISVGDQIGRKVKTITTAVTISLDSIDAMHAAAVAVANAKLIKIKLSPEEPAARLAAVMAGAPDARYIIDPNESWSIATLEAMAPLLADSRIALVEQPLPADSDAALRGLDYPARLCADESIHDRATLDAVLGKYDMINIKLDKTGGLTEALALQAAAREAGLGVMNGCMICSSLSIAPALLIACESDIVDLDGPWWLAADRPGGCRIVNGELLPPAPGFWGDAEAAHRGEQQL